MFKKSGLDKSKVTINKSNLGCTANKPLLISLQPGSTYTQECPIHPEGHAYHGRQEYTL